MIPHDDRIARDLLQNASDRLDVWMKDTIMRCEAGDLSVGDSISILISALLSKAMEIIHKTSPMTPAEFAVLMHDQLKRLKERLGESR